MKALKKKRLSELVADEIKAYIKREKLKSGDRLPSVAELVQTLGIGRSSLREALQLLESQGALEVLNGKGTFINDMKPFHIQVAFEVENEKKFLLETLEVREALERKAVELAVISASEADINQMSLHLKEYVTFIENDERDKANQADAQFHQAIYRAAKNPMLESIIDSVWDTFHEFWNVPFGKDDIFDQSYPFHESLLKAIRERDSDAALQSFREIMRSIRDSIERF
ncbi:FadR family transcriptional regulator [Halobacillus shinanisalinarum]|uniref:FadR family transcriptional regulator n=1 Tax=Halobacillus shinanisalinarum TaxID=2932258 RepID=A0ABY4H3K9_9BACI|nr:FadR/GntR family transcriptional regulator [Halobacillus shinanisalinarum]UOQ94876.1 FadR family transcriptional regulator [Halobacillus shinanisalinarum]